MQRILNKFIGYSRSAFVEKEEEYFVSNLKNLSKEICALLYQYAIKTSFMDIDRRCQILKSSIDYIKLFMKLFKSLKLVLQTCRSNKKYPEWCMELRNCSLEISLRSSLVYYLKGLKDGNVKALLDMMKKTLSNQGDEQTKESQKLIFNINTLEAVYRLPATSSTKELSLIHI